MLDKKVVREFWEEELEGIEIPDDISKEALVKAFCKYVEDDYYEWLKDNFKSFFNCGNPDWQWIRWEIKRQTPIYQLIERFEGKLKRFFKLRPKGRPKKKFDK